MAQTIASKRRTAEARAQFARAANGLAGHEVTDPVLKDLVDSVHRDELTAEQAIAKARRHVQG